MADYGARSFNAPTSADPSKQCVRAVLSDVHVSGLGNPMFLPPFPDDCALLPDHAANEEALEFLCFDLLSCTRGELPLSPCP
jgi:hypothetical protein